MNNSCKRHVQLLLEMISTTSNLVSTCSASEKKYDFNLNLCLQLHFKSCWDSWVLTLGHWRTVIEQRRDTVDFMLLTGPGKELLKADLQKWGYSDLTRNLLRPTTYGDSGQQVTKQGTSDLTSYPRRSPIDLPFFREKLSELPDPGSNLGPCACEAVALTTTPHGNPIIEFFISNRPWPNM